MSSTSTWSQVGEVYHLSSYGPCQQVSDAFENRDSIVLTLCDLTKAFDHVSHNLLLDKLRHYGLCGTPLSMLESYMNGRMQCVAINGSTSATQLVPFGVPQGTVLGPLLLILHINYLSVEEDPSVRRRHHSSR